jgi:predicted transcriptional regulator of viral defense system
MQSIDDKIITKIKKAKRGTLYFAEDFLSYGTAKAVAKALERLEQKDVIERISRGIYSRTEVDPIIGPLKPSTEAIAEAIRKRDKARIMLTGAAALNALGLSTQVPMNVVYLTDGAARKIDLGKRKILFKKGKPEEPFSHRKNQWIRHSGIKRNRKRQGNGAGNSAHSEAS